MAGEKALFQIQMSITKLELNIKLIPIPIHVRALDIIKKFPAKNEEGSCCVNISDDTKESSPLIKRMTKITENLLKALQYSIR